MKNLIYQNALKISEKYCTKAFINEVRIIHNERERFLNNFWKNDKNANNSQKETRRMDMDTITVLAKNKLSQESYIDFIFEIACSALDCGEAQYAEELLLFLTTRHNISINNELQGYILQKLGNIQMYYGNIKRAYKYYKDSLTTLHKTDNQKAIAMLENDIDAITNKSKVTLQLNLNSA